MYKYFRNNEIDKKRWDECIMNSPNGLIYAYSWFLDIVTPGWDAIIFDDYNSVMPLPVKRKFGLNYIAQPYFAQQLGIFGIGDYKLDKKIITLLKGKFLFSIYNVNSNSLTNDALEMELKPNYLLQLDDTYKNIFDKYSKNHKRNVEKAKSSILHFKDNLTKDKFLDFYIQNIGQERFSLPEKQFTIFKEIISDSLKLNYGKITGVYMIDELVSATFLLYDNQRIYNVLPISNDKGYKYSAQWLIIDTIIQENLDTNKKLDFFGSKIDGVAKFYKGFGAYSEGYQTIKLYPKLIKPIFRRFFK